MAKSRLTSKGQVTIPKNVREQLGLQPGDEIEFVADRAGFRLQKCLIQSPFTAYRGFLRDLAGCDPDALIEEMRGQ